MSKKIPLAVDVEVGRRIKLRRRLLGMSQSTLATHLGITFQQVQKYENGTNRVGASRLQQIAEALHVPVASFFDADAQPTRISDEQTDDLMSFLATAEGRALNGAFWKIQSKQLRRKIVALIETAADKTA